MSEAREEILRRIRAALGDRTRDPGVPGAIASVDPPGVGDPPDRDALAELLCERIRDYAAEALRIPSGGVAAAVADACAQRGLERLGVAPGVPVDWRPGERPAAIPDDGLSAPELDDAGAVLTGCALAIAETGTVVLDGGPLSGRRVLTLVPDHHICVVRVEQIVHRVPAAIAALHDAVAGERAPVTLVSGSSATSDIELERVEGVHGPRDLLVLIAG